MNYSFTCSSFWFNLLWKYLMIPLSFSDNPSKFFFLHKTIQNHKNLLILTKTMNPSNPSSHCFPDFSPQIQNSTSNYSAFD